MDVFGAALLDYYKNNTSEILWLYNSYGEPEEMPVEVFFRDEEEMDALELKALSLCAGNVLDVGAGVGSHALLLQKQVFSVTAIDICSNAVNIMKNRGVRKALLKDVFTVTEKYDTLLFLMNGIGFAGTLTGLKDFLVKAKLMLNTGGQLLFDSSDISYLYEEEPKPSDRYFGEISYCYQYKNENGDWFKWLYIDQETLRNIALEAGWKYELILANEDDQYLARLTLN